MTDTADLEAYLAREKCARLIRAIWLQLEARLGATLETGNL